MENLKIYTNEIDTIFACLSQLETLWQNQDNINFINNLKEYQEEVTNYKKNIERELTINRQIQPQNVGEDTNDR